MKKISNLLGDLSIDEFLRDYWQKKPLLIRGALPDFKGLLNPEQLISLACTEEVQSRLVTQPHGQFALAQSPFSAKHFKNLSKHPWTVLVQGVNHHLPSAAKLLKKFDFIPHARLDDLMVSYAPRGGGVGPHFDPYDVFLLQGMGHRRWQISTQSDRTLIEGAPLRILQDFKVEQEWILAPGDMLYLPPQCAHNGIAEDDCMTYSIGFRTPAYQELAEQFLVYLQDRICVEGMYADPDLNTQLHPSEISDAMLNQVENAIKQPARRPLSACHRDADRPAARPPCFRRRSPALGRQVPLRPVCHRRRGHAADRTGDGGRPCRAGSGMSVQPSATGAAA